MTINIEDMKAYMTIQVMMKETATGDEKCVMSLFREADIRMARLQVERGFLEEVDSRSTDDPNERCFKLTVAGKQNLEVTDG